MPAKMRVEGVAETTRAFDKLADDIEKMNSVHEQIARARIPGVATRTPVLTGELRGSWGVEARQGAASILSPLTYSLFLEVGTRHIPPVGMVAETLAAEAQQVAKEYEKAIEEIAKRRGFKVA